MANRSSRWDARFPRPGRRPSATLPRPCLPALLAIAIGLLSPARAADEIEIRGKTARISGTIQSETPTEVTILRSGPSGQTETVPVDQIVDVRYDKQPLKAAQARIHEQSATRVKEAVAEYAAAAEAMADRPAAALAMRFAQARAQARLALADPNPDQLDKAMTLFTAVQHEAGEGRLRYPTAEWLARLSLAKKNFAKAEAAASELAKAPWPQSRIRARLIKARALAGQGRTDEALAAVDAIVSEAVDDPAGQIEQQAAALFKAELQAKQKPALALETIRQVIARTPSGEGAEVLAQAYDLMGDVLHAQGKSDDAALAYLHVNILYPKEREADARALYALGQLWKKSQPERAHDVLVLLRRQHPESPLAGKTGEADDEAETGSEEESDSDAAEMAAPGEASESQDADAPGDLQKAIGETSGAKKKSAR